MRRILTSKGVYHLQIVLLTSVAIIAVYLIRTTPAGTMHERIWIGSFFISGVLAVGLAFAGPPKRHDRRSRKN